MGGGVGGGVVAGPNCHPPFTQTPVPKAANGLGVVHPPLAGGGGGGGVVVGGVVVGAGAGAPFGGYHPPLKHVPPSIDVKGSGVAQPPGPGGGGGVCGAG